MSHLVYEIRDLVKVYNKKSSTAVRANQGIDLEIPQGSIFGIFGPNGAGKTTLIKQLMGLLRPTEGEIRLYGENVVDKPEIIPEFVGYCGQMVNHFWMLNAWEALTITGRIRGMSKQEASQQATEFLEMMGFGDKRKRLLRDCSGGELRLISVFVALMGKRPVIVLDEPTTGLDPVVRKQVWDILFKYRVENEGTIILVTHNVLEAEKVVDQIAIVDEGKVVAQGKPSDLKAEYPEEVVIEVKLKGFDSVGVQLPGWTNLRERVFAYTGKMAETDRVINLVAAEIGMERIEDIKVTPFSLEDYYVKKVGKAWK